MVKKQNINEKYVKFTNHFNGKESEVKEEDTNFLKTSRFQNK